MSANMAPRPRRKFPTWLTWLMVVIAALLWTYAMLIVRGWYR